MKPKLVAVNAAGCRIGETHHRARLTDLDVELIFALHEAGLSYRVIGQKFDDVGGIAKSTVRDIIKGRIRAQYPERFKVLIVRLAVCEVRESEHGPTDFLQP